MSNPFEPNHAYSVAEFMERSGIGKTTTYSLIGKGRLDARKITERKTILMNCHEFMAALPKLTGAVVGGAL